MKKLLRVIGCMLLVAVSLVANQRTALACSCILPPAPQGALASADAVFAGRASAKFDANQGPLISSADPIITTFQVNQVWKGPNQPILAVKSERFDASCGFAFEIGRDYLVYANSRDGALETNVCTRTSALARAAQDLQMLGVGQAVAPPSASSPTLPSALLIGGAAAGILLLALVGGGIIVAQKRDKP